MDQSGAEPCSIYGDSSLRKEENYMTTNCLQLTSPSPVPVQSPSPKSKKGKGFWTLCCLLNIMGQGEHYQMKVLRV